MDADRCVGCLSCELACAVAHSISKTLTGALIEKPRSRVHVEAVGDRPVPMQCRQCEDAPCVSVCPSGALSRSGPEQPVLFEAARCIGCKMCIQVCPFGSLELGPDGKGVLKCDLCIERLEKGETPACVAACPTRALRFEPVRETAQSKRRRAAEQQLAAQDERGKP